MNEKLKFEDITSEFDAEDISKNKILSLFAYLGILVLVPLFAAKDSKFAKFHANQGLVIFIAEIIINVAVAILGIIFSYTIYKVVVLGAIVKILINLIVWVARVVLFALSIYGIVNCVQGNAVKFPVIEKISILK